MQSAKVFITSGDLIDAGKCMVFDPVTGKYAFTLCDDPGKGRKSDKTPDVVLLKNGEVFITGGLGLTDENIKVLTVIYNPDSDTFRVAAPMDIPRVGHTATLLNDGRVLITGGKDVNGKLVTEAEIYTRSDGSGAFTPCKCGFVVEKERYTATLLADGKVLVAGGKSSSLKALSSVELYDPSSDSFSELEAPLKTPRVYHTATLLVDGSVLIVGGKDSKGNVLSSAEMYKL